MLLVNLVRRDWHRVHAPEVSLSSILMKETVDDLASREPILRARLERGWIVLLAKSSWAYSDV